MQVGVEPVARDWPVREGTFFSDQDVDGYAAVIVLGSVASTLFADGGSAVGKYVWQAIFRFW